MTDMPAGATVVHEPHGWIHLEDFAGSDLEVVNAAKVSLNKHASEMGDSEKAILRFLLRQHHGTPFEHNYFKFVVRAPIFVFREWHRHRVGISINEQSARYVEMEPDFYIPADTHLRMQTGKPGNYKFEPYPDGDSSKGEVSHKSITLAYEHTYEACWQTYTTLLSWGLAKELARVVLPVGLYSQMYWTCNARSLMHFLALRNASDAMREIRDYAQVMEMLARTVMPLTFEAFDEFGRVAP